MSNLKIQIIDSKINSRKKNNQNKDNEEEAEEDEEEESTSILVEDGFIRMSSPVDLNDMFTSVEIRRVVFICQS